MKQQKGILFAMWIGLLSALSGFVNITTLLLYEKPTTHMTGNVSGVLIHAMSGETSHALTLLLIIISFYQTRRTGQTGLTRLKPVP